jgi:hypothetical protein
MRFGSLGAFLGVSIGLGLSSGGLLAAEREERRLTTGEIEDWLEAEPGTKTGDVGAESAEDEPLPAPRRHGLTLESGIGFVSQLGSLRNVTPTAPLFQLRVGYELFEVLMPFVEADVAFMRTTYANEPPPPRTFFHFGGGAGLRGTLPVGPFGIFLQGSVGLAKISEQNVLSIYGFPDADEFNLYLGGELGFEWYQVNPHLALGVHAGVRHYGTGLTRDRGGEPPLALLGSLQLRYAF